MSYLVQRIAAGCVLAAASPLLVLICVAVRVLDGRPVIYVGERVGRDAEIFDQLKFRTMPLGSDKGVVIGEAVKAPRTTRLGALLRKSSLDELPQLVNIVRGDMALVGPRPLHPDLLERVGADHDRFKVLPGLTGLAQISGRNHLPWSERLKRDQEYVAGQSIWLDLKIIVQTVSYVLKGSGITSDRNSEQVLDI